MRKILVLLFILGSRSAFAQLDTVGIWRFGLTGGAQVSGMWSEESIKSYLGLNGGVFLRKEKDECSHYQLELLLERTGFLHESLINLNAYRALEKKLLTFRMERGVTVTGYWRFQYGLHLSYLYDYPESNTKLYKFKTIDYGVNVALMYYSSEQLAVGIRYSQGLSNVFTSDLDNYRKHGLNYAIGFQLYLRIFN